MRAWNLTRGDIVYRHDAFTAGLRAVGYDVQKGPPSNVQPGDVVLSWNRYSTNHDICTKAEQAGGRVLISENGYLGPGGMSPHSMNPRQWYALGCGAHNDELAIPSGGAERWQALGVDLQPWRANGGHVLVCPNRSFGRPDRAMPLQWGEKTAAAIRHLTKREVRLRPHPGNAPPTKPLADDLRGAYACVIWSSSAGVHALVAGVPVICAAPFWICKSATSGDIRQIESPPMPDRLPALERMAFGQWHVDTIASGEAFKAVLNQ